MSEDKSAGKPETKPTCPACGQINGGHLSHCKIGTLERELADCRRELEGMAMKCALLMARKPAESHLASHAEMESLHTRCFTGDDPTNRPAPSPADGLDERAALLLETFARFGMQHVFKDGKETPNAKLARETADALRSRSGRT